MWSASGQEGPAGHRPRNRPETRLKEQNRLELVKEPPQDFNPGLGGR
jgi:hypothetical protein